MLVYVVLLLSISVTVPVLSQGKILVGSNRVSYLNVLYL